LQKHSNKGLIIFAKNPEAGKVKTRLAASIGDKKALDVYLKLMSHTRDTARQVDTQRYLFYDQAIEDNDSWSEMTFDKDVQSDGDLGDRMKHAFVKVLQKESKAIIIGSDCPEISAEIIEDAFSRLELADVVIGPTHDGGYYLLGMKEEHPFLFDNMEWSTEAVFENTINRITDAGLLYYLLPQLSDLDNIDDLVKFPAFGI